MPLLLPKKLIEVSLPLDAINAAAAREKSIRHGHPSTLHLWWARRPLAAARAVIFAQLVHDPEDLWRCQHPGEEPNTQVRGHWTRARNELFRLIEDLVLWENTTNEEVLGRAREAIRESWRQTCALNRDHPRAAELFNPDKMPGLHDPFAGGGAIPLEAQRLGLEAHASDLNPVAVLINKAMIEFPPRFAGRAPVHPSEPSPTAKHGTPQHEFRASMHQWKGAAGLADDVRHYGAWMRDEAERRIGHLYPKVRAVREREGGWRHATASDSPNSVEELTVIAWLWARTVKSPNPAFAHLDVPLASTFILSSKEGKEAYVQPIIGPDGYRFTVKTGTPPPEAENGTKLARANFGCIMSKSPISGDYIKAEGNAGRLGARLMAIVAEGQRGRVYLEPCAEHVAAASLAKPTWRPEGEIAKRMTGGNCTPYGLTTFGDLFTPRQLVALTTFSDLVGEARERIRRDAIAAGWPDDDVALDAQGSGARAYGEAVGVYLGLAVSRLTDICNALCRWETSKTQVRNLFGRQAIPMIWDFAENNVFGSAAGDYETSLGNLIRAVETLPSRGFGIARQADAQRQVLSDSQTISSDPPYYDNIGYADLSDFFYVWLRRTLRQTFPSLLSTIAVPKADELVATPYRHGSKEKAEVFFLEGMTEALRNLASRAHLSAPLTIYYAFKQSETSDGATSNTGWETFLEAVMRAGLSISGTWPMRTELSNRMIGSGTNALASSIVLVCRPRAADAGTISRRQFVRLLNETLPAALDAMTRRDAGDHSPVAPVDLSQAIIGPGMAIFSRYSAVLEADGSRMSVKTALQLINRFLAEGDFDPETQFCLQWFETYGWQEEKFGTADNLARSKGTAVESVKAAGVIASGGGRVRLLRWRELSADWDPATDHRLPVWEVLHRLIRAYQSEGDAGAARVLAAVAAKAESARALAYRLHTLCNRQGWAEDARAYNEVVQGWSGIETTALATPTPRQTELF